MTLHAAMGRLLVLAGCMTLWQRVLVAVLPAALGALAAQWHESCLFDRLGDPQAFCLLEYFWYPPAMDIAFALLVLAPFLGPVPRPALRMVGLVGSSVLVHLLVTDLTVGFRGTIEIPGIDSIFLNVVPVAVAASLAIAICTVGLAGRSARPRLWGLAVLAGCAPALVFLAPDLMESVFAYTPLYQEVRPYSDLLVWPVWHMSMAAALHLGLVGSRCRITP